MSAADRLARATEALGVAERDLAYAALEYLRSTNSDPLGRFKMEVFVTAARKLSDAIREHFDARMEIAKAAPTRSAS